MKRMTWAISLFRSACVAVLVAAAVAPLAASGDEVAPAGLLQLSLEQRADQFFGAYFVAPLATVFFWEVPVIRMPIVVLWLLVGSIYFTLRMGFVNVLFCPVCTWCSPTRPRCRRPWWRSSAARSLPMRRSAALSAAW